MKLLFKQKFFSWFDSYDIYNENGTPVYNVKGQLSWGHCLKIFNNLGKEIGTVKQVVLTFLPKFEIYLGSAYAGCISRDFSLFKPSYNIDYNGWHIEGDFMEWDYTIYDTNNNIVAVVTKELFNFTDTYSLDIYDPANAILVLMFVLAIDAEKCSRN